MLVARAGVIGTYSKRRKGTGKNYLGNADVIWDSLT